MPLNATKGILRAPKPMSYIHICLIDLFQWYSSNSLPLFIMIAIRRNSLKFSIADGHESVRSSQNNQDNANCCETFHHPTPCYRIRLKKVHRHCCLGGHKRNLTSDLFRKWRKSRHLPGNNTQVATKSPRRAGKPRNFSSIGCIISFWYEDDKPLGLSARHVRN